ncbi:MAG TPA: RtcB family protein [bacterium]|nr:RtcB family protein [bacterium]
MLRWKDDNHAFIEKTGAILVSPEIFINKKLKIDDDAIRQLINVSSISAQDKIIATPDIHTGFGVPIGCVWASCEYISPCAVGYDINCGMRLITTPLSINEINIKQLADSIKQDIPLGEGKQNIRLEASIFIKILEKGVKGLPEIINTNEQLIKIYNESDFIEDIQSIEENGSMQCSAKYVSDTAKKRGQHQLGTLGGGNHFIEIQKIEKIFDEDLAQRFGLFKNQCVIMLHSGSRGLGAEIGDNYMKLSLSEMQKKNITILDKQLTYFKFDSDNGKKYFESMKAASNFAFANRQIMTMFIRKNFRHYYGRDLKLNTLYDVSHNIAKLENYYNREYIIHRKGATRAFPKKLMFNTKFANTGQPVLIPGSMGSASYILVGIDEGIKSMYSINHGAGRVMSRRQALGKIKHNGKIISEGLISDDAFKKSMDGIYLICENKKTIKEEAPAAYKNIDAVIEVVVNAKLAKLAAQTKPVAVLKG